MWVGMSRFSKFLRCYLPVLKLVAVLLPVWVLVGCTTQYTVNVTRDVLTDFRLTSDYRVSRSAQWTLNPKTHLYLARGVFFSSAQDVDSYPRLNNAIFNALAHSLGQVFPATGFAVGRQSFLNALAEARIENAQVLVYPSVVFLHDERNSMREISEGTTVHPDQSLAADKIAFKVVLVDVYTGDIIDVALITGRSKMFTLDNDGPVALLPHAALAYTQQISGGKKGG